MIDLWRGRKPCSLLHAPGRDETRALHHRNTTQVETDVKDIPQIGPQSEISFRKMGIPSARPADRFL